LGWGVEGSQHTKMPQKKNVTVMSVAKEMGVELTQEQWEKAEALAAAMYAAKYGKEPDTTMEAP